MLIDKKVTHLYQKNEGYDDAYTIIYPMTYLDDIYTDFSMMAKVSVEVNRITKKIEEIRQFIESGEAPVTSICGQTGEIKLTKSDIKRYENDPNGLDQVDNTSDKDKPVSNSYQNLIMEEIHEKIIPAGTQLTEQSAAFRYHVSGNGGYPIQTNPHRDTLDGNIYYNGNPIELHPENFVSSQDVQAELLKHNDDLLSHTVILDLIKQGGSIDRKLEQLQEEANQIVKDIYKQVNDSSAPEKIEQHNDDSTSHSSILDEIQEEKDRLEEIKDSTIENPMYEYQKKKVHSVTDTTDRNNYPSVLATYQAIKTIGRSVSFVSNSVYPYISLHDDILEFGTNAGVIHQTKIPTIDEVSGTVPAEMIISNHYIPESLPAEFWKEDRMAIALLPLVTLFTWRNYKQTYWNQFRLDYGIPKRSTLLCYSDYHDEAISEKQIQSIGYTMSGLHFSKYDISIYNKPGDVYSEMYHKLTVNDDIILGDLFITNDTRVDASTRTLQVLNQSTPEWGYGYPCKMVSFDIGGNQVSDVNIGYRSSPPVDGALSHNTEGKYLTYNTSLQFAGQHECVFGLTFRDLQFKGARIATHADGANISFGASVNANKIKMQAIAYHSSII